MGSYVAFDVSLRSTSVHVVDEAGKCLWRGKCATEPDVLAATVRKRAPEVVRVGLETGFLSTWLCHALAEAGLPMVCMDARQARAVLSVGLNKTDANDAECLAQLLRTGFFREVRVKSWDSMLFRNLITARRQLVRTEVDLANQLRGILRTFGLALPPGGGGGRRFEAAVRERAPMRAGLSLIVLPLLEAWRAVRDRVVVLDKAAVAAARRDTPADDGTRCRRDHGPDLRQHGRGPRAVPGCPRRRCLARTHAQPLSIRRDRRFWAYLALWRCLAADLPLRGRQPGADPLAIGLCPVKRWGLMVKAKNGRKKAVVAMARKLSVILHAMWKSGEADVVRTITICPLWPLGPRSETL